MKDQAGRVVVVTGASKGLGRAMTLGFAAVVAGERPTLATWAFAAAVVAVVAAQRASAIAFVPRGASAVAAAMPPAISPAPAQARPASPTDPDR